MLGNHRTKDGKVIPICFMETDHIINTINLMAQRLFKARELSKLNIPGFIYKLGGFKEEKISEDRLDEMKVELLERANNYLLELARRSLILKDEMAQEAFVNFIEKIDSNLTTNFQQYFALLTPPKEDEDGEFYYEDDVDEFLRGY